ncbi:MULTISPECIES: hypothetical protein [unclassified Marinobacter]|jgi:hypothetical protein|uniref:hypothetical protein n=1 Tax=unclassified Marinobacter TaxID=83889 RepID=UPI00200EF205|nr:MULTISPECIES: hypothetical protein [unclassified Marinobacter]MCL1483742.1 hypothetical protein [Marinobacter sp.]UQG55331.1 hypothetical protein MIH16_18310 [Marinobacter sp. M4C]UQG64134.1 hypothetical protein MIH17_18295 [Marinobacter sp. M2C]UQG68418.1 hypothetical protein MIH19_18310 [Marinobacter sp. M1C]
MDIKEITQRIRWKEKASEVTMNRMIERIYKLTDAIERQFPEVRRSNQIKLKHMLFLKNAWFCNEGLAPATIEDYTRAMRLIIAAKDKTPTGSGHSSSSRIDSRVVGPRCIVLLALSRETSGGKLRQ